jgi:multidrug resistance efflux pump
MGVVRFSLSLFGAVAVIAATLAAATIWLLLTDPVTVADAVKDGQVSPLVRALAGVLYDAMKGLLKYI